MAMRATVVPRALSLTHGLVCMCSACAFLLQITCKIFLSFLEWQLCSLQNQFILEVVQHMSVCFFFFFFKFQQPFRGENVKIFVLIKYRFHAEKARASAQAQAETQSQVQAEVSRMLSAERALTQESLQQAVLREMITVEDERLRAQLLVSVFTTTTKNLWIIFSE